MDKESIIDTICQTYCQLSTRCKLDLLESAKILQLQKGSVLVREGQCSDKTFYIVQGSARAYYKNEDKDVSDWFAFGNDFISPIVSFFTGKPSPHFIEVMEDSTLLEFSKSKIDIMADKYHDFERLMRIIVSKTMLSQQERIASILFQKAEQRYESLLKLYPNIVQRIPLTHISSYLGITLETLSRIRRYK